MRTTPRWKTALMSLAVVGLFGYTSVSLGTGVYDYAMEAPCRDGLGAALAAREREWNAVSTNQSLQKLALAYHAVFAKFRDRIAALSCPIRVEGVRTAALVAIDEYLVVLATIVRDDEYIDATYSAAQDKEHEAVARLEAALT